MSLRPREIYRFGPFELDATGRVLQHQGTVVALTPKAIDTLVVLVREQGRTVERDALMKAVWPDTFVEEAGLTRNVSALRKALENDSDGQQYIETVSKRGYRFVAKVTAASGSDTKTHNLPIQVTTFIGRQDEIAAVHGLLASSRVVTLAGAGGIGKTRLALRVGETCRSDFPDGVWLVELAPLADQTLVAGTVASVLGVRDRVDRPIAESLSEQLRTRSLLVLLDNCEHLIDASARLVHLLVTTCPGVKVLATSREALNVPGESMWRVRSLERLESVQLFAQRARAARTTFELTTENTATVEDLCRRLDGLPLAIELAAARVSVMSPIEIADRLGNRFQLLTGGSRMAAPRQQTLEATVAWSYELLSDAEQLTFDRLSVFAGGCTLDAAERVCGDLPGGPGVAELIARLVDRSLVVPDDRADGRTRYRMLETLRQFGHERLVARAEMADARQRHLAWAVALAESAPLPMVSNAPPGFGGEMDNLRTAMEWASETGASASALRILSSAPWIITNLNEFRAALTCLLPFAGELPIEVQGKAYLTAGMLAFMIGDWAWGVETLNVAADLNAKLGDTKTTSMSLSYAAGCSFGAGDLAAALEQSGRAVAMARTSGSTDALSRGLLLQGWLETDHDLARAEALATEGEAEAAKLETIFDRGHCRELRGFIHCLKGELDQGAAVLADAMTLFEQIQVNCGAHVLETAAAWAAMNGRFVLGAEILGSAQRIRQETGDKPRPWERVVQDVWLPKIAEALDPAVFEKARRQGAERAFHAALDFARHELQAVAGVER